MQLRRIAIHPEGARARQLIFAVAAAQQPDAQHARPARGQQIPDRVSNDITIVNRNAEPLLAGENEIRRWFRAQHIAALDDDGLRTDSKGRERAVDFGTPTDVAMPYGTRESTDLDGRPCPLSNFLAGG
jgi:hypothetical protein